MMRVANSTAERARPRQLATEAGESPRAICAASASHAEFEIGIIRYRLSPRCEMRRPRGRSRNAQDSPRKPHIAARRAPKPESAERNPTGSLGVRFSVTLAFPVVG